MSNQVERPRREKPVTLTPRAVRRYDRLERVVYQTAVKLAETNPTGFDADSLAKSLGCTQDEAAGWLRWLRDTGDFDAVAEPGATH